MDELTFDPNSLTVGELCDLGDVVGEANLAELSAGKVGPKALLGLMWILGRRADPDYTLEAARAVKVVDVKFEVNDPAGPVPLKVAGQ